VSLTTTTSSRTHRDLDTLLYPSTVGCNPCYLILRGIGCGETGPLSLGALHRAARFLALLC
jgi:hypothetical protein